VLTIPGTVQFSLRCCSFTQRSLRGNHHGHDWQDQAAAQPWQEVRARDIAHNGISRNTVAKWLHEPVEGEPKYRRGEQWCKLSGFQEALEQALKADTYRPKLERRSARALFGEIKASLRDHWMPASKCACHREIEPTRLPDCCTYLTAPAPQGRDHALATGRTRRGQRRGTIGPRKRRASR